LSPSWPGSISAWALFRYGISPRSRTGPLGAHTALTREPDSIDLFAAETGALLAETRIYSPDPKTGALLNQLAIRPPIEWPKHGYLYGTVSVSPDERTLVLRKFRDQVLYLKHNLNAAAIGSLRGQADNIQGDIQRLMEQMNRSIAEADRFIQTL